ncbi:uncharacterized protein TM35_000084490 [Trypanosoma theileri]|uniref:Uncharacterized protein n=1 Tax=Trypanosoma theileri TaxID=67003 RepID=A0A1X0P1F9_9TRYP|nr:uncharacterized protein TM35_000084490 [Trypanosoma theileri]ORC90651.1 hypothetical protein TM35_000084490 [Trypanosoma theileri]
MESTSHPQPSSPAVTNPKEHSSGTQLDSSVGARQETSGGRQDSHQRDGPPASNSAPNTDVVSEEARYSELSSAGASEASTTPSPRATVDTTASDDTPGNSNPEGVKNADVNVTKSGGNTADQSN